MSKKTNIALIGMPGAGKSTIGRLLADRLAMEFYDADTLIEQDHSTSLQELLDKAGYLKLREFEEQAILSRQFSGSVIATGGSVIYAAAALAHLKTTCCFFYLHASIATLQARINNWSGRGIASPVGQSFDDLYAERSPLYEQYADYQIPADSLDAEAIAGQIAGIYQAIAMD